MIDKDSKKKEGRANTSSIIYIILKESFVFCLSLYLVGIFIEGISEGIISNYLNLKIVLYFIIILGVCYILTDKIVKQKQIIGQDVYKNRHTIDISHYVIVLFLSVFIGYLTLLKFEDMGWLVWLIASLSALTTLLISIFIINENKFNK